MAHAENAFPSVKTSGFRLVASGLNYPECPVYICNDGGSTILKIGNLQVATTQPPDYQGDVDLNPFEDLARPSPLPHDRQTLYVTLGGTGRVVSCHTHPRRKLAIGRVGFSPREASASLGGGAEARAKAHPQTLAHGMMMPQKFCRNFYGSDPDWLASPVPGIAQGRRAPLE
jgi:hypothetical protein